MILRKRWPEGPLGFPLPEHVARHVEAVLRRLPHDSEHRYRHVQLTAEPVGLDPGERCDISWISTETPDRAGEVVLARGMDDTQFRQNPLVTLNHDYDRPPAGRSLWRRRSQEAGLIGIKARTHYPPRPPAWPDGETWLPDQVFALVQSGLLRGKSIGFLPLRVHAPTPQEAQRRRWPEGVRLVIDEWLLLEYACVSLPANPDALVESVTKSAAVLPCATVDEVERAVRRRVEDALEKVIGRI